MHPRASVVVRIRLASRGVFFAAVSTIVLAGCSHASAPAPVLERFSLAPSAPSALLSDVASGGREALVLSTCHRTELYCVVGHPGSGAESLVQALARIAGLSPGELRAHTYVRVGRDAIGHAVAVASGLDSVVLGEDQILAQWKRALSVSRAAGVLGPVLDRLGSVALASGKRVRAKTGIGRHAVSLESLAVRAVTEALGTLEGRRLLIVGTGDSAALIARLLIASGAAASQVTVLGRTPDRARAFAAAYQGIRAADASLAEEVASADAVICCAAAPHALLTRAHLVGRTKRASLVCVDLGMPRNVDDAVRSAEPPVRVVTLSDLSALAEAHREARRRYVPAAQAIVEEATASLVAWLDARGVGASIGRLQAHGQRIAEEELGVAMARLGALDQRQRRVVTALARRIVGRLLHSPSVRLKDHPEGENIALALEYAFGLHGGETALRARLPRDHGAPDHETLEDIA